MGRFRLSSTAALIIMLIILLAMAAFNRPTAALTSAEAIDAANAHPNVGVIMVWRDANNPQGLPGGLATYVTGVLIHPQTILTAGHFTARVEGVSASGALPPWLRIVASFSPNAFDRSTWIDLNRALGTCMAHPSFPRPCTPQSCPFDDIDGQYEPGISDIGLCFLDEPVLGVRTAKLANRSLDDEGVAGTRMRHRGLRDDQPAARRPVGHVELRRPPSLGHVNGRPGRRSELGDVQPRSRHRLLRRLRRADVS